MLRHSLKYDNGWLSPEGKLYGCCFAKHVELSYEIIRKRFGEDYFEDSDYLCPSIFLENQGWLKLHDGRLAYGGPGFIPAGYTITQAQLDTIFDWCKRHKVKMPVWVKKAEVL